MLSSVLDGCFGKFFQAVDFPFESCGICRIVARNSRVNAYGSGLQEALDQCVHAPLPPMNRCIVRSPVGKQKEVTRLQTVRRVYGFKPLVRIVWVVLSAYQDTPAFGQAANASMDDVFSNGTSGAPYAAVLVGIGAIYVDCRMNLVR